MSDTPEGREQKTVQTVQETQEPGVVKRKPWFEVAVERGQWHWMLWSGNGRQMATNCVPYRNQSECKNAIAAFVEALGGKMPKIFVAQQEADEDE